MAKFVDADKLTDSLTRKKSSVANQRYTDGFNDALMRFRSMLSKYPTADVVEVVHSEWKDDVFVKGYPSVKCPECNIRFCDIISNHRCMWHYCPNCGAKMDGERRSDE
jgi:hypothetical protein